MYYRMLPNLIIYVVHVVWKLHSSKQFKVLFCDVQSCQWSNGIKSARESARNWDKERWKRKLEKRKRRRLGENRVFKWVCRKAVWHWNRHAPSHNSRDINFSTPLFSRPPSLFSSLPLSFSPSALLLHLASSLSLTPFPPLLLFFFSFPLLSSFLFLFTPSYPCNWIVLSLLNLFLLSHPTASPSLLLALLTSPFFSLHLFLLQHQRLSFLFLTHILRFSCLYRPLFIFPPSPSHHITVSVLAQREWVTSGPTQSQDHRVTLQKILEGSDTVAIWQSIEQAAPHTQTGRHNIDSDRRPVWRNGLCPLWPVGMSTTH